MLCSNVTHADVVQSHASSTLDHICIVENCELSAQVNLSIAIEDRV